ncbi:MAG TPA: hypothetical protein VNO35_24650 [Steroidobacteraceae bacterium]|nr:hypothetical protein [Steroidobacteraceae bacterium]
MSRKLTVYQKDDLTAVLMDCEIMQTLDGRHIVLEDLRDEFGSLVNSIDENSANQRHIRSIVNAFGNDDSWIALIDRVKYYTGEGARPTLRLILAQLELEQTLFQYREIRSLRQTFGFASFDENSQKKLIQCYHQCAHHLDVPQVSGNEPPYPLLLTLAGFPRPNATRALEFAGGIKQLLPELQKRSLSALVAAVAAREKKQVRSLSADDREIILFFGMVFSNRISRRVGWSLPAGGITGCQAARRLSGGRTLVPACHEAGAEGDDVGQPSSGSGRSAVELAVTTAELAVRLPAGRRFVL